MPESSRRLPAFVLLVLAAFSGLGCGQVPEPLRIAAAADLQVVLPELIGVFAGDRPGARPEVLYGASGLLARQIEQGAPVDLFLSADRRFVEELAGSGVIEPSSAKDYTQGVLCLVVHQDLQGSIHGLADLESEPVKKIAIANPESAPYGRAARQTLISAGLWDKVQPKLVFAENVRQAYQFVSSGNADVAFIGSSLAGTSTLQQIPVAASLHEPILQRLGIIRGCTHAREAQAFANFLIGSEAQQIFQSHGFLPAGNPLERGATAAVPNR